jgi:hypothetical protein
VTECIACGECVEDDEAAYGQGTPDETEFTEMVEDNESKNADELFAFDDGPYCGFDCLLEES